MVQTRRQYQLLIYQVPSQPSAARVGVWRELKRMGALYLQQSVCIFPTVPALKAPLHSVTERITTLGGMFHLLPIRALPAAEEERYPDLLRALVIGLGIAPRLMPPPAAAIAPPAEGAPLAALGGVAGAVTDEVEPAPAPKDRSTGWLLIAGSLLLASTSLGWDLLASSSKNGKLEAVDFLPLAGYGGSVTLFIMGLGRL